ncbi:MAG: hypothetical protein LBJ67_16590 [Planctomycetaceae bacterium]|jgi:flagellar motor switch protein FliG|nr:hypothetical protein [Planctomycetaceae bacterium]
MDARSGIRKAAIFLNGLDWETANTLLKRLPTEEACAVRQEMVAVQRISREEIHTAVRQFLLDTKNNGKISRSQPPDNSHKTVISGSDSDFVEFSSNVSAATMVSSSAISTAYHIHDPSSDSPSAQLENLVEPETKHADNFDAENQPPQQTIIQQNEPNETMPETCPKRFDELERMTPFDAAVFLAAESEQLIAVVLSQLTPQCSRGVLACFEQSLKRDVIRRLAKLDETDETILDEIDFVLKQRLTQEFEEKNKFKPGLALLEQILQSAENESANDVDNSVYNDILLGLNEIEAEERNGYQEMEEPEYQDYQDNSIYGEDPIETYNIPLITFEHLALLDDFDLGVLFRGQNSDLMIRALSACDPIFIDRVLSQFPVYEQITFREMIRQTFSISPEEQTYSQECILQGALQLIQEGIIADVIGDNSQVQSEYEYRA